jgi:hypothetical protein
MTEKLPALTAAQKSICTAQAGKKSVSAITAKTLFRPFQARFLKSPVPI